MAITRTRLCRTSLLLGATILAGASLPAVAETTSKPVKASSSAHHKAAHKSAGKRMASTASTTSPAVASASAPVSTNARRNTLVSLSGPVPA
ncbi:hypothetical protein C0V97_18385, partial [Asaia sp. W19]